MSFHPFNEVAQAVTTALNSPEPVASALAQANWSRPFDSLAAASDDTTWQVSQLQLLISFCAFLA
jgi:hypothetical protein